MNTRKPRDPAAIPGVSTAVFRGKKHIRRDLPCQDACAAGLSRSGWPVAAVADGVSSSPHSEVAAQAATRAIVAFWEAFDPGFTEEASLIDALRASMNYALMATDRLREKYPEPYGLETTLSVMLAVPEDGALYYACVGDGGIYRVSTDGSVRPLVEPMRDAEGAVYTLSEGPKQWRFGRVDLSGAASVLAVTDGVSDVIRAGEDAFAAAGRFVPDRKMGEDYAAFCERALDDPRFRDMDDDAAIALYTVAGASPSPAPWNAPGDETLPESKDGPAGVLLSALEGTQRELRNAVNGLKSLILNKRGK